MDGTSRLGLEKVRALLALHAFGTVLGLQGCNVREQLTDKRHLQIVAVASTLDEPIKVQWRARSLAVEVSRGVARGHDWVAHVSDLRDLANRLLVGVENGPQFGHSRLIHELLELLQRARLNLVDTL